MPKYRVTRKFIETWGAEIEAPTLEEAKNASTLECENRLKFWDSEGEESSFSDHIFIRNSK